REPFPLPREGTERRTGELGENFGTQILSSSDPKIPNFLNSR
ncbi:unnamed protein product, partial [Linum tenue]